MSRCAFDWKCVRCGQQVTGENVNASNVPKGWRSVVVSLQDDCDDKPEFDEMACAYCAGKALELLKKWAADPNAK